MCDQSYWSIPNRRVCLFERVVVNWPGLDQVLFLNAEQQAVLTTIVAKLGANPTQECSVSSNDILGLWNKFFPTERRLGGFAFDNYPRVAFVTYPAITDIEFLDSERTKAVVRIVVGSEGGTIVLEKEGGTWTAIALRHPLHAVLDPWKRLLLAAPWAREQARTFRSRFTRSHEASNVRIGLWPS
jgi:hypothetical protein